MEKEKRKREEEFQKLKIIRKETMIKFSSNPQNKIFCSNKKFTNSIFWKSYNANYKNKYRIK